RTVGQADREVPARGCEGNRVRVKAPVPEIEEAASLRAGRRLPEANGAVQGPGNDPIAGRVEGNPQYVLGVAGEGSFFFGREVAETKSARGIADRGQRLGVRAECQAREVGVAVERGQAPTAGQFDQLHRPVGPTGRQPATIGAEGDGANQTNV